MSAKKSSQVKTASVKKTSLVKSVPTDTQHSTPLKVAIVHDWLVGGGAELVVEQLHKLFPEAPIYTSYATAEWRARLDGAVVTGWLQHFGRGRKFLAVARIWWFTHLKLKGYDVVISSSGAEAKGVKVPKGTVHINYCHAPTHYYWSRYSQYMKRPGFGALNPLARFGLWLLVKPLRRWDYKAAQRPDFLLANSTHIQQEIETYYKRKSTVVFPPVAVARFQATPTRAHKRAGFLICGRQTPYKRFDLAVVACTKLGLPLTVIGDGPDNARLRRLAGKSVTFLGKVSDEVLAEEIRKANCLIFPGLEDFGITAVEAMAAGTPVIAYRGGGALDYIKPGVTGEFFDTQTAAVLAQSLRSFNAGRYSSAAIQAYAQRFSEDKFRTKIRRVITAALQKHKV